MTREETKREMLFAKRNVVADSWIDKAYDMAIQALSEPERKKGRWIEAVIPNDKSGLPVIVCDQCVTFFPCQFGSSHNFCPECGANMRGESNE